MAATGVEQSTLENASRPHLPSSRILGYAAGDAGCNIAFQMTGLFLLVFYTDVVGIKPIHAGNIFLFVKIWDAFADLFAGRMVDRTMTRWGKFRPFLLWYSVPLLASNLLCFWIPVDGYGAKLAWATISYAVLGLLYSLVNIPYGSLAGAMSQNPVDRSRLASARMVGSGSTILLLALVLAPQIKASDNLAQTFLVTAAVFLVIGPILFFITFATARETVVREVPQVSLRQTIQTVTKNGPAAPGSASRRSSISPGRTSSARWASTSPTTSSASTPGELAGHGGHRHHHRRGHLRRAVRPSSRACSARSAAS